MFNVLKSDTLNEHIRGNNSFKAHRRSQIRSQIHKELHLFIKSYTYKYVFI